MSEKRSIRIKHLLTMTAGLDWPEFDKPYWKMKRTKDWVDFIVNQPMAHTPGDVFTYNSGASHLLSAILTRTTELSAAEYAELHLFKRLGFAGPDGTAQAGYPKVERVCISQRLIWLNSASSICRKGDGMENSLSLPPGLTVLRAFIIKDFSIMSLRFLENTAITGGFPPRSIMAVSPVILPKALAGSISFRSKAGFGGRYPA